MMCASLYRTFKSKQKLFQCIYSLIFCYVQGCEFLRFLIDLSDKKLFEFYDVNFL